MSVTSWPPPRQVGPVWGLSQGGGYLAVTGVSALRPMCHRAGCAISGSSSLED